MDTTAQASHPAMPSSRGIIIARRLLATAYLMAGLLHMTVPRPFLRITPGWVPFPHEVIFLTGICEVLGAIGLLVPRTRRLAGLLLALYAVCVFPANIKHAIDDLSAGTGLGLWYHVPRLLAQPLILRWALIAGEVTRWPFRRRAKQVIQ